MSEPSPAALAHLAKSLDDLPLWGKTLVAGGALIAAYLPYAWLSSNKRATPIKTDFRQGVVYLYQLPRTKLLPSISESCLALETWLRMADIPYENVACGLNTRGLDGAIPFIEIDGQEISHARLAIQHLRETYAMGSLELDRHLSEEQRATCHSFEKLIHLSLASSHLLYRVENIDKTLTLIPTSNFGFLSILAGLFLPKAYLGRCTSIISSTPLGGYTREQRIAIGKEDIRAISRYLGSKHFFTGFKPTTIDATLFASLAQILYAPYESEHNDLITKECSNLAKFVERMRIRYWPDWNEVTTKFTTDSNWRKRVATPTNGSRAHTPH